MFSKIFGKKGKDYYISLIFISLSVLFWGYSFISTKIVLQELSPISIAFFRQLIAVCVLVPWLFFTKAFARISFKNIVLVIVSSLFGIVLYFVFENTGLQYTTASSASMIVAAVPVFTLITEVLFFKLKPTFKMVICILISILGVYFVISVNGKLDFTSSAFKGNMLVIGAMIAWVVYTIINKTLCHQRSSILVTTYQTIASIPLFLPLVLRDMSSWRGLSPSATGNLIYLGVFCSAFAYYFYLYAAKRLGATISSAFLNLIPAVSIFFGYLLLDEKLTVLQITGITLILISLFKLSQKDAKASIENGQLTIKKPVDRGQLTEDS